MFDIVQNGLHSATYRVIAEDHSNHCGADKMLETVAIILLVLWALGMVSSYTIGGLIHILLVVALIVLLFRFIRGRAI